MADAAYLSNRIAQAHIKLAAWERSLAAIRDSGQERIDINAVLRQVRDVSRALDRTPITCPQTTPRPLMRLADDQEEGVAYLRVSTCPGEPAKELRDLGLEG